MRKVFLPALLIGTLVLNSAAPVFATGIDDFKFFEEEAKIVTASRREQPLQESPVAVEVITAEDIQASGAVNLWDLMRFRAGMNVSEGRSLDGNRAIVSVRGFSQEFVNSLQVLVDGRSVYQALTGGVYWEQLPLQIQDIDRIEVVRGPNAALYGSNAGLGVINIITKKPAGRTSLAATAIGGNLGTRIAAESFESQLKSFGYRLSHTFRENGGYPLDSTRAAGNDFLHDNKLNFRGAWAPRRDTSLEIFAGGVWETAGLTTPGSRGKFDQNFQMMKLTHSLRENSSIEATVSRNDLIMEIGPLVLGTNHNRSVQYDAETLYHVDWLDERMNTTAGVSYRYVTGDSRQIFVDEGLQVDKIGRAFISQSARVLDKLSLVGAVSAENSKAAGLQPAYQAAALYQAAPEHSFRLSYSVAPTLPNFYYQHANSPLTTSVSYAGNPALRPAKLDSYEAGYRGAFERWRIETSLYYMRLRDMQTTVLSRSFPLPLVFSFANNDSAIARGVETSFSYHFGRGRSLYANYTYEHISSALGTAATDRGTPAHAFNLGGMTPLGRGFSASTNMGYKDSAMVTSYTSGTTVAVPAHTRVDVRLSFVPPANPDIEVFMACQNMTQQEHVEFADGLTVPRTYNGGVTFKFR